MNHKNAETRMIMINEMQTLTEMLNDAINDTQVDIDFDAWTADSGITVENGGVFLMDPTAGPSGSVVVAQITVPTERTPSIVMGAQGHVAGDPGTNWQCSGVTW